MHRNVHDIERAASIGLGSALTLSAVWRRRDWRDMVAGAAGVGLLVRGFTGWCGLYQMLGLSTRAADRSPGGDSEGASGRHVERSVDINASLDRVYRFWRNLENLPKFMGSVRRVRRLDNDHSRWTVAGAAGETYEYDAEMVRDVPNHMISWESLPGSDVNNAGTVFFEPIGAGGTRVRVILHYHPPVGKVGDMVAEMIGGDPEAKLGEDLHRLRDHLERQDFAAKLVSPR